jgi:hypothetical protein
LNKNSEIKKDIMLKNLKDENEKLKNEQKVKDRFKEVVREKVNKKKEEDKVKAEKKKVKKEQKQKEDFLSFSILMDILKCYQNDTILDRVPILYCRWKESFLKVFSAYRKNFQFVFFIWEVQLPSGCRSQRS